MQFAARRGYRLSVPWYLEGVRIEVPAPATEANGKRGIWGLMVGAPAPPRIDVELKGRRRATRVKITLGDNPDSIKLAYELQAYLHNEQAYVTQSPPMCPKCGSTVPNPIARYCGRCGHAFTADADTPRILRPPPIPPPPVPRTETVSESRQSTVARDDKASAAPAPVEVPSQEASVDSLGDVVGETDEDPFAVLIERDVADAEQDAAVEAVMDDESRNDAAASYDEAPEEAPGDDGNGVDEPRDAAATDEEGAGREERPSENPPARRLLAED